MPCKLKLCTSACVSTQQAYMYACCVKTQLLVPYIDVLNDETVWMLDHGWLGCVHAKGTGCVFWLVVEIICASTA